VAVSGQAKLCGSDRSVKIRPKPGREVESTRGLSVSGEASPRARTGGEENLKNAKGLNPVRHKQDQKEGGSSEVEDFVACKGDTGTRVAMEGVFWLESPTEGRGRARQKNWYGAEGTGGKKS